MPNTTYRFISWNINGIRASIRKETWKDVLSLNPAIASFQEIKAGEEFMTSKEAFRDGFTHDYEFATMRKGYSGVATYINNRIIEHSYAAQDSLIPEIMPDSITLQSPDRPLKVTKVINGLSDPVFDEEGRLLTHLIETKDSGLKIAYINGYYPQGGRGPHRIEYKIKFYKKVHELCEQYRKDGYGVILCGDFNTTVGDIDLARPKENRNVTGCLPEEREALDWFLKGGYVDTFRHFYPEKVDMYSYWDQITRARERNVGWRIDYYIVSEDLIPRLKDAFIWMEIPGSDHCPVGIDIEL